MRRILINSNIEAIVKEYTDKLLKKKAIKTKNLNTDNLDRITLIPQHYYKLNFLST